MMRKRSPSRRRYLPTRDLSPQILLDLGPDDAEAGAQPGFLPAEETARGQAQGLHVDEAVARAGDRRRHQVLPVAQLGHGIVERRQILQVGRPDLQGPQIPRFEPGRDVVVAGVVGLDIDDVRAEGAELGGDRFLRPRADRDHGHHRGDPDDHAQQGQGRAELVGEDGPDGQANAFEDSHEGVSPAV